MQIGELTDLLKVVSVSVIPPIASIVTCVVKIINHTNLSKLKPKTVFGVMVDDTEVIVSRLFEGLPLYTSVKWAAESNHDKLVISFHSFRKAIKYSDLVVTSSQFRFAHPTITFSHEKHFDLLSPIVTRSLSNQAAIKR